MTQLVNGAEIRFSAGLKGVDFRMSSGSAKLQISVDGSTFLDIPDTDKTESVNFNITTPKCKLKAILTGDAVARVRKI